MTGLDWASAILMAGGGVFFLAGTAGLLRFPEVHSRLHALTKADNLGLGLVVLGLLVQAPEPAVAAKLLLIWLLALLASATSCYLIAGSVGGGSPAVPDGRGPVGTPAPSDAPGDAPVDAPADAGDDGGSSADA